MYGKGEFYAGLYDTFLYDIYRYLKVLLHIALTYLLFPRAAVRVISHSYTILASIQYLEVLRFQVLCFSDLLRSLCGHVLGLPGAVCIA